MFKFFNTLYFGNTFGQWATAFLTILLSVVVGRALYLIFGRWVKRFTKESGTKLDDILVGMVRGPVVLIIILVGIRAGLGILTLPGLLGRWIDSAFQFLIPLLAAWLLVRLYDTIHQEYLVPFAEKTETNLDNQLLPVIRAGLKIVFWSLGVVIGLNNAGYNVTAILAGLGIGGLAFALAAQDTVSNIFGGITIFIQKPFKVGDRIEVADFDGWVKEIGIRNSTIEDFSGQQIVMPNKMFIDSPVRNIDTQSAYWIEMSLNLRYDTPPDKIEIVLSRLKEIAANNKLIDKAAWASFDLINDYSFVIFFRYGIKLWQIEDEASMDDWFHKISTVKTRMNLDILKMLEANDVKLALPVEVQVATSSLGNNLYLKENEVFPPTS